MKKKIFTTKYEKHTRLQCQSQNTYTNVLPVSYFITFSSYLSNDEPAEYTDVLLKLHISLNQLRTGRGLNLSGMVESVKSAIEQ